MKKHLFSLLIPIIIVATTLLIYFKWKSTQQEPNVVTNPVNVLENKIDSLYHIQDSLFKKINQIDSNQEYYIDLIDKNNELIFKNNHELTKIKNSYDEKVNNANNYSIKQLDSFFTNRYKGY